MPLLPFSNPNQTVTVVLSSPFAHYDRFSIGDVWVTDYFTVTWNGGDIVARVDEVFQSEATVFLNYDF